MCGIFAWFGRYDRKRALCYAERLQQRGPDSTQYLATPQYFLGFHRLSIMDPSSDGNQPFVGAEWTLLCNGEIYNAFTLQKDVYHPLPTRSSSDCEVLFRALEAQRETFTDLVQRLYGVYALVAVQKTPEGSWRIHVARDRVGVRPLYWVVQADTLVLASEPCALTSWGPAVTFFPPDTAGYLTLDAQGHLGPWTVTKAPRLCLYREPTIHTLDLAVAAVRNVMERAVRSRLLSDRPIACLLSGGVDSSAVAALVARYTDQPLHTFSVGLTGSTDLQYARQVAQHLGSIHHEVCLTEEDFLKAVPEVVTALQSYDVTTVRASTPMYLLSRHIAQTTDFKVVFSGEGPDEVCGSYLYFHASPDPSASEKECRRLVQDMHLFDILRADRSTAHWGLEVRVPLLGVDFIETYWSIDPALRQASSTRMEKWILRKAVEDLLPADVVWRRKEAFSDGVSAPSRSWSRVLQEWVDSRVSETELTEAATTYPHHTPQTKEALWLRRYFDQQYPSLAHLIPYQWLPRWVGAVQDPSARILSQYWTPAPEQGKNLSLPK